MNLEMFLVLLRRLSMEVRIISKKAEYAKHADCMAQFKLCWQSEAVILPFRLMTDLWPACCVIKMRENSLSESANLFKDVNVIEIRTKWFGNFRRFELSRVNWTHGSQNWFELSGVREIEGSINRG